MIYTLVTPIVLLYRHCCSQAYNHGGRQNPVHFPGVVGICCLHGPRRNVQIVFREQMYHWNADQFTGRRTLYTRYLRLIIVLIIRPTNDLLNLKRAMPMLFVIPVFLKRTYFLPIKYLAINY